MRPPTALLLATGAILATTSAVAHAAAPVIVNSPNANWTETGASQANGNRFVFVTFVARHDPGRRITSVVTSSGTLGVTSQYLGTGGNSTGSNRMASSLVRFSYSPPTPAGLSCGFFSGVRRVDQTLSFSVRDDIGQQSAAVSQNWRVIADGQCLAVDDYPTLAFVSQSATTAAPGQNVSFTFNCNDPDGSGSNDRCDHIFWRKRRLNDGSVTAETFNDAEDGITRSFFTSFPTRGVWVVEARLCSEDSCQDGSWWRLGSVQVNETAPPTVSLAMTGAGVVSGPGGYSVNQGDTANAVVTVSDSGSQGAVQALDWSSGRFDFATPQLSGTTVVQSLTDAQRTHAINTSTHGLKSISVTGFDNGAIDGADFERRQGSDSESIYVNARPTANGISTSTPEDTPKDIALQGNDADNQPAALTYEIVSQPAQGSVSLAGGTATYAPPPGFNGTTFFTYRAKDGPVSGKAWSFSNTATVTVTVTPVNDPPLLDPIGNKTVNEGEQLQFQVSATDPDGDALTYSASNLPAGATFDPSTRTFTWTPGFDQSGTYPGVHFEVSDGNGGTDSEDITITVNNVPVHQPGRVSARGTVVPENVATATFSAANNCTPKFSTRPSIVDWPGNRFTKTAVTSLLCHDDPLVEGSGAAGFDTQEGTADGTLSAGGTGTLEWTYVDGGPGASPDDRVEFIVRNSGGAAILIVGNQTPAPLGGTPGGVWTFPP